MKRFWLERGGLISLATLALYLWIAPSHVVDGDNAEFATLGALGGAAHPTGYPGYVLWLRAWSWLPAASPAHAAALATALLGAAQMLVLHAAARAWGARTGAATAAIAIFAGAPVVIAIYTEAEVFAYSGLVVALVLWLAGARGPVRGAWRCGLLGLVAGLGLANHLTCALVAPVGVLGIVRGIREADRRWLAGVLATCGLVAGLLPYLYLLIAPDHAGTWGGVHDLSDVAGMILRRDYGGPTAFAVDAGGRESVTAANFYELVATLGRSWLWAPAVLGVVALGARIARPGESETRAAWLCLAAAFALAGPLLVLRFDVAPVGIARYAIHRFHLLPALLLVVPVASAFELIARRIPTAPSPPIAAIVGVVGLAAVTSTSLPHILHVHAPAVEAEAKNLLRTLPDRAVVIGASDELYAGVNYVQLVLGERRDVTYVQWPLMTLDWYRDRAGLAIPPGPDPASVRAARAVLASGRPLFVDYKQLAIRKAFPTFPEGIVLHVLPAGAARPSPEDILALNKTVFDKFELGYELPGRDDEWPAAIHIKYAFVWRQIAANLDQTGHPDDARWAAAAAAAIGPQ